MERMTKLLIAAIGLIALNTAVLDYFLIKNFNSRQNIKDQIDQEISKNSNQSTVSEVIDSCGEKCQAYIETQIASAVASLEAPVVPTAKPGATVAKAKVRTTSYVPIPGSGSTGALDWINISGTDFYFNTADYPGLVSIYFEPTISLTNGNGTAYVRLYDATHNIAVEGGWSQTNSQTPVALESGQAFFWAGKNLIRVQAKSLTADTAVFHSGRLKIVTEN